MAHSGRNGGGRGCDCLRTHGLGGQQGKQDQEGGFHGGAVIMVRTGPVTPPAVRFFPQGAFKRTSLSPHGRHECRLPAAWLS